MNIKDMAEEAYETAKSKGWHDDGPPPIPQTIALYHSELSEALEEFRKNTDLPHTYLREDGKPEGFLVELADVFIRIGDTLGAEGLTDQFLHALRMKMDFNKTRPHRHGGKNC